MSDAHKPYTNNDINIFLTCFSFIKWYQWRACRPICDRPDAGCGGSLVGFYVCWGRVVQEEWAGFWESLSRAGRDWVRTSSPLSSDGVSEATARQGRYTLPKLRIPSDFWDKLNPLDVSARTKSCNPIATAPTLRILPGTEKGQLYCAFEYCQLASLHV